jgi:putative endonuclease
MGYRVTNLLGAWGERVALRLYLRSGYSLVARNIYNPKGKRYGEIDLIMKKGRKVVFVEVKARSAKGMATAAESISFTKRQKLVKTVYWFLNAHPEFLKFQPRIDVCIVEASNLDNEAKNVIIIPNAVEANG